MSSCPQVDGLLSKAVQAASLLIRPIGEVEGVELFNDLPAQAVEGGVMIELGDLWAGEQRTLLIGLHVPAMPGLGLAEIATLELRYVALPNMVEETVTLPIFVNVVPGDQAAGRMANPKVRQELLFQQAQEHKRTAMDDLARGDATGAAQTLRDAARPSRRSTVRSATPCSPCPTTPNRTTPCAPASAWPPTTRARAGGADARSERPVI